MDYSEERPPFKEDTPMYDYLDKEFLWLKNAGGIREKLWKELNEHKLNHNYSNLYDTLWFYVAKFEFSFGIKRRYKGSSDIVAGYSFYINNAGQFLPGSELGLFYPENPYKSERACMKACVKWVLYHIERLPTCI